MAADFASMPFFLEMGEFFLTFLLIFTTVYGLLWKTNFISDRRDVNAVTAFAMALTVALSGVVPYIIRLIPFYMLMFLVIFAIYFLGKFVGVKMEEVIKSRYVALTIVVVFAVVTAVIGWQLYSENINAELAKFNQTNMTNESGVNLTGNVFTDTVNSYNYQCVQRGNYLQSVSGPNFMCLIMHPRVLGMIIVLLSMAAITGVIMYISRKS